jgi:hypothetical protein
LVVARAHLGCSSSYAWWPQCSDSSSPLFRRRRRRQGIRAWIAGDREICATTTPCIPPGFALPALLLTNTCCGLLRLPRSDSGVFISLIAATLPIQSSSCARPEAITLPSGAEVFHRGQEEMIQTVARVLNSSSCLGASPGVTWVASAAPLQVNLASSPWS